MKKMHEAQSHRKELMYLLLVDSYFCQESTCYDKYNQCIM